METPITKEICKREIGDIDITLLEAQQYLIEVDKKDKLELSAVLEHMDELLDERLIFTTELKHLDCE